MALISLKEWAQRNGITVSSARERAQRGTLKTAVKIANRWLVEEDEPKLDHRYSNPKEVKEDPRD